MPTWSKPRCPWNYYWGCWKWFSNIILIMKSTGSASQVLFKSRWRRSVQEGAGIRSGILSMHQLRLARVLAEICIQQDSAKLKETLRTIRKENRSVFRQWQLFYTVSLLRPVWTYWGAYNQAALYQLILITEDKGFVSAFKSTKRGTWIPWRRREDWISTSSSH